MNSNSININNKNITPFRGVNGAEPMSMDDKEKYYIENLHKVIDDVSTRSEREVPEYGEFAPVSEFFKNVDKDIPADKFVLRVIKMPKEDYPDEKQRFIEASVFAPAGDYKADMLIGAGHKKEILETLKSKDFPTRLNDAYIDLIDMLKDEDRR